MMQSQFRQHFFTLRGQRQQNLATVVLRPFPADISASFQAIHQFHRAVMPNVHPVSEFPNPRPHFLGDALDREHELVLTRLHPSCPHRVDKENSWLIIVIGFVIEVSSGRDSFRETFEFGGLIEETLGPESCADLTIFIGGISGHHKDDDLLVVRVDVLQ